MLKALIATSCLIIYGSLFPLLGWAIPTSPLFGFLVSWPASIERADLIQNILAYIPLGFFIVLFLARKKSNQKSIIFAIVAIVASGFLSLSMESIQQFLPSRVSSLADLVLNLIGSAIGAMFGLIMPNRTDKTSRIYRLQHQLFCERQHANIGIVCICIWALAQTSPWVPTFDISQIRHGGSAFYRTALNLETVVIWQAASYFLSFLIIGLIWTMIVRIKKYRNALFGTLFAFILTSKIFIYTRQLSFEAFAGFLMAFIFLPFVFLIKNRKITCIAGIIFIGINHTIMELHAGKTTILSVINWIPFFGQLQSLNGFQAIAEVFWIGFALAFFVRALTSCQHGLRTAVSGGICLIVFLSAIVWAKQFVPGRFADITPIIICMTGWLFGWHGFFRNERTQSIAHDPARP